MNKCKKWYGTRHTFGKWEIKEQGNVVDHDNNPPLIKGIWIAQQRKCEVCNYIEFNLKEYR